MLTFDKKQNTSPVQAKLNIGQANDVYEQEADRVAEQVVQRMTATPELVPMSIQNQDAPIQPKLKIKATDDAIQKEEEEEPELVQRQVMSPSAGDDPPVQRKSKNDFSMAGNTSGFESQLMHSKGQGTPMPHSSRQQMEAAFGSDFGNVRIHTGGASTQMNQSIHAKAFTHGSDIYFNQSNFQPHSTDGQKLLAHELTHTIQQGQSSNVPKIQRTEDPSTQEGFEKLPESVYVLAAEDFYFFESPSDAIPSNDVVAKDHRLELTWKSTDWYFAFSENGTKGYVKTQNLVFPPEIKKPAKEEFAAFIGDILFIQAKNMHRAFVLAKEAGLTPNVGMVFWWSNGVKKPYPVKYEITIRDPSEEEIERMGDLADFSALPRLTGSAVATPGHGLLPEEVKLNSDQKKWQAAEKELAPYIEKFLITTSETLPGRMVSNVPMEWIRPFNFIFEEFRVKKGFPFSQDDDSEFVFYMAVYNLSVRAEIKKVLTGIIYKPEDPKEDVGSLEWWIDNKERLVEYNKAYLDSELEKIVKEEQEKRKADIEAFFKPYKDDLEREQNEYIEKAKAKIDKMEGWYNREVASKAAMEVIERRQKEVLEAAQKAFLASTIQAEIVAAIEARYEAVVKTITDPNPYTHATIKEDADLVAKLRDHDAKLAAAVDFKAKDKAFHDAFHDIKAYLEPRYPDEWILLLRVIIGYFSDNLLVGSDGKISVYAIKEWAERNIRDIKETLNNFTPLMNKRMKEEYETTRLATVSMKSIGSIAYTDLLYEFGYAQIFFEEVLEHPENDEGFWDGFTSKSLGEFMPFVHSIMKISRIYEQNRVASKMVMGGTLTLSEELLLKAVAALHQINAMKEKPFWYEVGEGVAETIPFIAEFIITLPFGLAGASVATSMMTAGIKKIGMEYLEKKLVKFLIKGVGLLAGSLAQTLANPLDIEANIMKHKMHVVKLIPNEDGSFTVEVDANTESEASAAWKGFITSYVNVFTERLGGKILPFVAGKAASSFGRFIPMVARNSIVGMQLKQTAQMLKKYAGFHGILGEYEEEVYAQILEAMLTGKQLKWDWEDQLKTFTVVAIVGAGMRGVQSMIVGYEILRTFKYQGRKVVLPVEVYNMLSRLTNEQRMQEFKEAIETMKLTTQQKEIALYLAQHTLNLENEINMASAEMADQQQGGTIPQTMSELVRLVIQLYGARKNFILANQENKTGHVESVLLNGDTPDASVPLLLYDLAQVDLWIRETESAIALLDGMTVAEIKEVAGVTNGIEENIQMWEKWKSGWRPYIDVVKKMSPESKIEITPDGRVTINDTVLISTRLLYRLSITNKIGLQQLINASQSGSSAKAISTAAAEALKQTHADSIVSKNEQGVYDINSEIQISEQALGTLVPDVENARQNKFLLEESQQVDIGVGTINQLTPEDLGDVQKLHPASAIVEVDPNTLSINNQIVLSKSFIKDMLLKNPTDLQRLLMATQQLEEKGGDIKLLDEVHWKTISDFSKTSGYRIRFKFQYETEGDTLIERLGVRSDTRFTNLWDKASHGEKVRFWDLVNEIGGYTKERDRQADATPELRQLAMDFALSVGPKNISELVDYYQYFQADFKFRKDKLEKDYAAGIEAMDAEIARRQMAYMEENDIKKLSKQDKKLFSPYRKAETQRLRDLYFGKATVSSDNVGNLAYSHLINSASSATAGVGTIDPAMLAEVAADFKKGETAMESQMSTHKIDPGLEDLAAINAVRQIQSLSFGSMTAAVYHVQKHHHELPESLQDFTDPTLAYMQAARKTVKEATIVNTTTDPINPGARSIVFILPYAEKEGNNYELKAIVKVSANGDVSLATLIISKEKKPKSK